MQKPEVTESIMETPAGSSLSIEESAAIEDALAFMLDEASQDRDGEDFLSRDDLQTHAARIMQQVGMDVSCDVPLPAVEGGASEAALDIVAVNADGRQSVVRIEAEPTPDGLERLPGLVAALKAADMPGRLYLATDILNGNLFVLGPMSGVVKSLMEREDVGIILADKLFILICHNHAQLLLEEMPHFVFPPPPPR